MSCHQTTLSLQCSAQSVGTGAQLFLNLIQTLIGAQCVSLPAQIGFIRYLVSTIPAGICKMGNFPPDPTAVVESELKVRGISNLRVIDASIMPSTLSGNINAACLMFGEKGTDLIKETNDRIQRYYPN